MRDIWYVAQDERASAIPVDEIMRLPAAERLRLAEQIWQSVRAHPDELQAATDAEVAPGRIRRQT